MGFLLISLDFPGPITLSLSLEFMGLPQTPYFLSLQLPWAYGGPFSLFYLILCPWDATSFFPGSFEPACLFKTHLFFCWACDPLFLPLGPNGFFAIYLVNFLWPSLYGFFVCWASTNGPQHLAPWTYEMFLRFICEWKGVSALLSSFFFFSFFAGLF